MPIVEQIIFHSSTQGGSDKLWLAAYSDDGQYYSLHGKRGSTLVPDNKSFGTLEQAQAWYNTKVKEKARKYTQVAFNAPRYGNVSPFSDTPPTTTHDQQTRPADPSLL